MTNNPLFEEKEIHCISCFFVLVYELIRNIKIGLYMNTKDDIVKLIEKNSLRKCESVQFKLSIPKDKKQIAILLTALANSGGGHLVIGVRETSKGVVLSNIIVSLDEVIKDLDYISTKLTTGFQYTPFIETILGVQIIIIEVAKPATTIYVTNQDVSPEMIYAYNIVGNTVVRKDAMVYRNVYKYMTVESFLLSLYGRSWQFCEPSKWNDKFEQRFYCATYNIPNSVGNTPQLFATCVTRVKNSEAAWKVYAHGQGLGAHCLQLELDIVELRKQLKASGLRIEEKIVNYKSENYISNLHLKSSIHYNKYFAAFNFEKFIDLLVLKREAYTYEKEVRLFIIPDMTNGTRNKWKNATTHNMHIEWSKVIKNVRIDKNCSNGEIKAIQQACFNVGIEPIFDKGKEPLEGGQICPVNAKQIEFKSFDIDEMPGSASITINQ